MAEKTPGIPAEDGVSASIEEHRFALFRTQLESQRRRFITLKFRQLFRALRDRLPSGPEFAAVIHAYRREDRVGLFLIFSTRETLVLSIELRGRMIGSVLGKEKDSLTKCELKHQRNREEHKPTPPRHRQAIQVELARRRIDQRTGRDCGPMNCVEERVVRLLRKDAALDIREAAPYRLFGRSIL